MEIFQTFCTIEGCLGKVFICDTIIYRDEPWLVLSWISEHATGLKKPERIVRLGAFPHQEIPSHSIAKWGILGQLPKGILDPEIQEELASDVIDHPEISILIGMS